MKNRTWFNFFLSFVFLVFMFCFTAHEYFSPVQEKNYEIELDFHSLKKGDSVEITMHGETYKLIILDRRDL